MIYWEKHDYERNRHCWCHVTLCRDLLGDLILSRRWGRIGQRGYRERKQPVNDAGDLHHHLSNVGKKCAALGYAIKGVGGASA
jgi:predicted DNA-binding WGR domain protein